MTFVCLCLFVQWGGAHVLSSSSRLSQHSDVVMMQSWKNLLCGLKTTSLQLRRADDITHTACVMETQRWCHMARRFQQTVTSQLAITPPPVGRHLVPEMKKSCRRVRPRRAERLRHKAPHRPQQQFVSGETDRSDAHAAIFIPRYHRNRTPQLWESCVRHSHHASVPQRAQRIVPFQT